MTHSRPLRLFLFAGTAIWIASCLPPDPVTPGGTGGATASTGGASVSTGGATTSTGGAPASGGASVATGGAPATTGGASGTGGRGTGGAATGGRASGTGGGATAGGASGTGGTAAGGSATGGATTSTGGAGGALPKFSFFVTSVAAIRRLSGSNDGFGGDLRYGQPTGLAGADKICRDIAETAMPGAGAKTWRAFLSTTKGGVNDGPVHAIERIGEGPWYDRLGRVLAMNKTGLAMTRPQGADPAIINDFPNEDGVPNHQADAPGCTGNACPDNHDFLTGTGTNGMLYNTDWKFTCHDWTSKVGADGTPRCGHSWPRGVQSWMSILNESGCAPGIFLMEAGPPGANGTKSVGDGGGYGGIYCFATTP